METASKLPLVHFVEWKKERWEDYPGILNELARWGVREIVAHPCWGMRDAAHPGSLAALAKEIQQAGLATPACHAYWGQGHDICFCDQADATRRIVEEHRIFLEKLQSLQVKTYTMHIGMEDNHRTPWSAIQRALDLLLPTAEQCGIILALENGHENLKTQQELADFVRSCRHPNLGICFDNGHAHCYGDHQMMETLRIFQENIVTCHLHDNHGTFDDHNPPRQGNVDWAALLPALPKLPRILHAETEAGDWSENAWRSFQALWESHVHRG